MQMCKTSNLVKQIKTMMDENVDSGLPSTGLSKKTKFPKNVGNYFREYCDATSIHGFRYFGESRTICEKIFWITIFVICLMFCAFSVMSVYKKWDQSPVIVSFSTRSKAISDIPFPAVTVCSESKVKYDVIDYKNAIIRKKQGENLTEKEESRVDTLSYVCNNPNDIHYSDLNYSRPEEFLDILREVSPDFSVINCVYLGESHSCEKLFKPVVTDDGLCYSFNLLDRTEIYNENVVHYRNFHQMNATSKDWSLHNGYTEDAEVETYPRRALLAGAKYGLRFDLKTENRKLDTTCRGSTAGYRLIFHSPIRLPRPSLEYIRVPYNSSLGATIRATEITTSTAVRNYSALKRRCYFPSEKKLKYFKIYSYTNCDAECLTNFTLLTCKCVVFHMPRENGTRICQGIDHKCTQDAEVFLQKMRVLNRVTSNKTKVPDFIKNNVCHCMAMCNEIAYTVGSSQSQWNWAEEMADGLYVTNSTDSTTNYQLSRVTAYFINGNFLGSERNELYGPTDFLANFGGLLGLFSGFSVLSLMEIIYFLSLRLMCNFRLYGSWAG